MSLRKCMSNFNAIFTKRKGFVAFMAGYPSIEDSENSSKLWRKMAWI